jgi:hypothetical protein
LPASCVGTPSNLDEIDELRIVVRVARLNAQRLAQTQAPFELVTLEALLAGVDQGRAPVDDYRGDEVLEVHAKDARLPLEASV